MTRLSDICEQILLVSERQAPFQCSCGDADCTPTRCETDARAEKAQGRFVLLTEEGF
jgi:hypothetical protein